MRPIERGPWPLDKDGAPKTFGQYSLARKDLIERMGQYCSYCGVRLNTSLAVEHVKPKALVPELKLSWDNFLLACTNCNSIKGDRSIDIDDYFWPDIHNTILPYVYLEDGKIELAANLHVDLIPKSQAMLDLVGLQKYPNNASVSDRRWLNRKEAYEKALISKDNYEASKSHGDETRVLMLQMIGILAHATGFFSIWYAVFKGEDDVIKVLIDAFPGTHIASFDENNHYEPIKRVIDLM